MPSQSHNDATYLSESSKPLVNMEEPRPLNTIAALIAGILWVLYLPFGILWITLLSPLSKALFHSKPRPSPERVLADGPAQVFLSAEGQSFAAKKLGLDIVSLNEKVVEDVNTALSSGRQLGLVVTAYYKGVEIVHVGGGLSRRQNGPNDAWKPVGPTDLFTINSVTKAVCASGVMKLVEQGVIDYDAPVTRYWPG